MPRREISADSLRTRTTFERRERVELIDGGAEPGLRAIAQRRAVILAASVIVGTCEVFAEEFPRRFNLALLRGFIRPLPERVHLFRQLLPALVTNSPSFVAFFTASTSFVFTRALKGSGGRRLKCFSSSQPLKRTEC